MRIAKSAKLVKLDVLQKNAPAFLKIALASATVVACLALRLPAYGATDDADNFKKITAASNKNDDEPAKGAFQAAKKGPAPASVSEEAPARVTSEPAPDVARNVSSEKPAAKKAAIAAKEEAHVSPPDSETSMRWLTNGNTRFVKKQFRADGKNPQDRQRLIAGAHPHAIILASSDSRVAPEIIFDQALGEIHVVRVGAETLDNAVVASVEQALLDFSPHLIVVMGHTNSRLVEMALSSKDGDAPASEALGKVLADIRARLKSIPAGSHSANFEIEATVNADGVSRELVKRSDLIRKRVESGELVIKPALYRMETGKVSFY